MIHLLCLGNPKQVGTMYESIMNYVMPRPMILVSLLFITGIVIQWKSNLSFWILALLTVLLLLVTLQVKQPQILFTLLILAGSLRVAYDQMIPSNHLSLFTANADSTYDVKALVVDVGETRKGTPKLLLRPLFINGDVTSGGLVLLYCKNMKWSAVPGDTVVGRMIINKPRDKRNPHDFDYRMYLEGKHIYFEAFLENEGEVLLHPRTNTSMTLLFKSLQDHISGHFEKYLSSRSAGILSALILGEKSDVEETIRNDFANTGVIHVLAVSGLHVGYVSLILITVFGLLRLPHSLQMISVVAGLIFYVGLTGSAPSVMRASIMASLMIFGGLLERKSDIINLLAAAAFIILLISPDQLKNIGFQLSFLAVFSIVTLFPVFKNVAKRIPILKKGNIASVLVPVIDLFLVSLAAQMGTLAITVLYFHKIPIISLIANLVVVPLIGVIVATGMSLLLLGTLFPLLAQLWAATLEGIIDFMLWFVQLCAQVEWAYISMRQIQQYELVLLLMAIFAMAVTRYQVVLKLWIILALLWSSVQIWQTILKPQYLELIILDVGQGDAILIHEPTGKTILIDTGLRFGGMDMGKDVILPYLQYRNWSKIDLLVLTHPHNDHIGGAHFLVENIDVGKVLMPAIEYDSYGYRALRDQIDSKGIPLSAVYTGHMDSTLKPIYFRVTGPRAYDPGSRPSNINNTSIILQVFYGTSSVLLTGDGEGQIEHDQLALGDLLKSDVIKAPHHGSITSSSQAYLNLVRPRICLMSLGIKNKFRHPSRVTLEKYSNLGSEIHRTDLEGAQVYRSDGKGWYRYEWKENI
jgi:competence protein ComEC